MKGAVSGAATGATIGSVGGPVGTAIGGVIGGFIGGIGDFLGGTAGKEKLKYLEQQESATQKALQDTLKVASQRRGIELEKFEQQKGQLTKGVSLGLQETVKAYNTAMQSTGLRSGAIEQQAAEQTTRVREKGAYDMQNLMDNLGGKLMSIDEWAGGREGALKAELHKIAQDKKQAAAQSTWLNPFD